MKEIVDARVSEGQPVVFECQYSGTPVPDVVWLKNDKLIRNTKNLKIQYLENKTTCTILSATSEDVGTYICKATSDIGLAVTKAKLYVQDVPLTEEQKAKFEEERIKEEKLKEVKKKKAAKKAKAAPKVEDTFK